ncbi:hypothetical protein BJY04DRAFT_31579 [Aspergillus karnatakaensis]|uniref:uncharacterized protein n=1 Tax=Aspergillus karnatakaensis TaxID=1810916 RepID=UPI003CCCC3C9
MRTKTTTLFHALTLGLLAFTTAQEEDIETGYDYSRCIQDGINDYAAPHVCLPDVTDPEEVDTCICGSLIATGQPQCMHNCTLEGQARYAQWLPEGCRYEHFPDLEEWGLRMALKARWKVGVMKFLKRNLGRKR